MSDHHSLSSEDLVSRLRRHECKGENPDWIRDLCSDAADCIEQLQMPAAKVRELAECDEGADSIALMRALGLRIEGQRKHIATLEAKLKRCRDVMECNDPINARLIFGEPKP